MKVKEFIEVLKNLDQDKIVKVAVPDFTGAYFYVNKIYAPIYEHNALEKNVRDLIVIEVD